MSLRGLPLMIGLGLAIGWLLPTRHRPAAPPVAPAGPPEAPKPQVASLPPQTPSTVLTRTPDGHFEIDGAVNGQSVHFVVDTGASAVALTVADAERIGLPVDRAGFRIVGSGASGPVSGQPVTLARVRAGTAEATDVPAVIIDGLPVSLLGQSFLSHLGSLSIEGDRLTMR